MSDTGSWMSNILPYFSLKNINGHGTDTINHFCNLKFKFCKIKDILKLDWALEKKLSQAKEFQEDLKGYVGTLLEICWPPFYSAFHCKLFLV
jgi:hypothetical protein